MLKRSEDMSSEDCKELIKKGNDMGKAVKGLWNLSQDEREMRLIEHEEMARRDQVAKEEQAFKEGIKTVRPRNAQKRQGD